MGKSKGTIGYRRAFRRIGALLLLLLSLSLFACEKAPTEPELYQAAEALLASGAFAEARDAFAALGAYDDAAGRVAECWLLEGKAHLEGGAFGEARTALENVKDLPEAAQLIQKAWYLEGEALLKSGDADGARNAFSACGDFEGAADGLKECDYVLAERLLEEGDLDGAEAAFSALSGYRDADARANAIRYQKADALLAAGEYKAAADAFFALGAYEDAAARYDAILAMTAYRAEAFQTASVGERIEWGVFEQDNDLENGPEPILWRVLSVEDGQVMLISEYVLDCRMFNEPFQKTRWDVCSLRDWLNGDFYENAFTDEEKQFIVLSTLQNEANEEYDVRGCPDTEDYVFVPSLTQAQTLFADNDDRLGINTPYAIARGAFTDENGAGWWWLRTPGYTTIFTSIVLTDGEASAWGTFYGYDHRAVRPCIVIQPGETLDPPG